MTATTLLSWSGKQPEWVQDGLRRIASSVDLTLSAEDRLTIASNVRHAARPVDGVTPAFQPLAAEHLTASSKPGEKVTLCSFGPVQNVDQLAAGQQLRFAETGLTLVFGENGSGKSGYTRIAKKLCRSLQSDDLQGNVFAPSGIDPIQAVVMGPKTPPTASPMSAR